MNYDVLMHPYLIVFKQLLKVFSVHNAQAFPSNISSLANMQIQPVSRMLCLQNHLSFLKRKSIISFYFPSTASLFIKLITLVYMRVFHLPCFSSLILSQPRIDCYWTVEAEQEGIAGVNSQFTNMTSPLA